MAKKKKAYWTAGAHSSRSKGGKTTKSKDLRLVQPGSDTDKSMVKNKDQSRLMNMDALGRMGR